MAYLINLMYHALYETKDELDALPIHERPYAVSTQRFHQQLEQIKRLQIDLLDPKLLLRPGLRLKKNTVLITFDDGHISLHKYALPLLVQHQAKALFFISTDWVELRNDFCNWANINQLKEKGMSIGSHGKTHRFLSLLNQYESSIELRESKKRLDQKLNQDTRFLSFPGGRYKNRDIKLAKLHGYTCIMTSSIGKVQDPSPLEALSAMPRFTVHSKVGDTSFQRIITANPGYIMQKKTAYLLKKFYRRLIGDKDNHDTAPIIKA